MTFEDINVVGYPLVLSSHLEVDEIERKFGGRLPSGYREYVTQLGEGVLGGKLVRIYPPYRILKGFNNLDEWRQRIMEYWFWEDGADVLSKEQVLEGVILGDTVNGDDLFFRPAEPERIYVLPHDDGAIYVAGDGLLEAVEWLCNSGVLTEPFAERDFEPFDSRG